ncbi:class F sortase [Blastococcus haudaquaticus]|uniref:Sortase family protein n=1 Tax=Blastococcus haudaquaticus TaxID=1938745 RepID=A0A286H177_9ACTN|nr:class F sortase [Blastococcus haudaquaticus]SOE01515.1 Sortase family protein [Blastococcus haudaquaticus]
MTAPRRRTLIGLVVAGLLLVGSGLALTLASPRADAQAFGPPPVPPSRSADRPTANPPAPEPTDPAPLPEVPAAPVGISLPLTPGPVPLVPVGVLDTGALLLPERPSVLGWYAAGALPGSPSGTVVVAGHVDSAEFGAGPLETLLEVGIGDAVELTDAAGGTHRYAVESRTSYPKSALPRELFRADGPPRLALVTCGGAFDEGTGQYADNVVVLAVPAH